MASIVLLWWDLCSITSLDASLCAVITGLHTMSTLNWHWIISMHPAELWSQSSLVDFQSYRNKTKKTNSFSTPLHPYPWFFPYFYLTWHAFFIIDVLFAATFYSHPLFISLPYLLPLLLMNSSQPSSDFLVFLPPSPPNLPFPLFQSTCDTLRSHSDSLGFAPNVLPSHPAVGNFEEFACWWRRRRDGLGYDGKLWNIYRTDFKRSVSPRKCTC